MEARDPANDRTLCELYVGYVPLCGSRQSVGQVCWEVVDSGIVLVGFGACFTNCEMRLVYVYNRKKMTFWKEIFETALTWKMLRFTSLARVGKFLGSLGKDLC